MTDDDDDNGMMPSLDGDASVRLLDALRRVHGEPRYDIAPELLKQKARSAASIPLR
jgi:hypothetical protein